MKREENEIQLILLRLVKTNKNGVPRTLLQYATPDSEGANYKGMLIMDQWFDGHEVFNKISLNDFGIPLQAHFVYEQSFRGMAKMKIVDIVKDGEYLLV